MSPSHARRMRSSSSSSGRPSTVILIHSPRPATRENCCADRQSRIGSAADEHDRIGSRPSMAGHWRLTPSTYLHRLSGAGSLKRLVACDHHTVHDTAAGIIGYGVVLGGAVVPERH